SPGIQHLTGFSVHQHVNGRTYNLSRAGRESLPRVDSWTSWTETGSEEGQNFAGVRGPGTRHQGKVARMNNHGAGVGRDNLGRTQGEQLDHQVPNPGRKRAAIDGVLEGGGASERVADRGRLPTRAKEGAGPPDY